MGITRDHFKKTGSTKGLFRAKIGTRKDRNDKDLREAGEIQKSWQEYTEERYKKRLLTTQITMMVLPPRADILECEVKWALGSITTNKASRGDGIAAELFKILKDDVVKVLHSNMLANLENLAIVTGLEKVSFHSNPKEKQYQRKFKLPFSCVHFTC